MKPPGWLKIESNSWHLNPRTGVYDYFLHVRVRRWHPVYWWHVLTSIRPRWRRARKVSAGR